jgi:flagellar hook-basal body complex protein FliE
MTIPIQGANPIRPPVIEQPQAPSGSAQPGVFSEMFRNSVQEVQSFQNQAQQSVDGFLAGESEDLHKVALATQKAELSFEMFLQVRNKVVQAYQEVMRMQV